MNDLRVSVEIADTLFDIFNILVKMEKHMKKQDKVHKVMKEFKTGKLHSGSKSGPQVTSRKQAVAIALSEARKGKK